MKKVLVSRGIYVAGKKFLSESHEIPVTGIKFLIESDNSCVSFTGRKFLSVRIFLLQKRNSFGRVMKFL